MADKKTEKTIKVIPAKFEGIIFEDENKIRFSFQNKDERLFSSNFIKYTFLDNGDIKTELGNIGNKNTFGFLSKEMLEYYNNKLLKDRIKDVFEKSNKKNVFYMLSRKASVFFNKGKYAEEYNLFVHPINFKIPKNLNYYLFYKTSNGSHLLKEEESKALKDKLQNLAISKQLSNEDEKALKKYILSQMKYMKNRYLDNIATFFFNEIKDNNKDLYEYLQNKIYKNSVFDYSSIIDFILDIIKEEIKKQAGIPINQKLFNESVLDEKNVEILREIENKVREYFKNYNFDKNTLNFVKFLENNLDDFNFDEIPFEKIEGDLLKNITKIEYINGYFEKLLNGKFNEVEETLNFIKPSLFFLDDEEIENIDDYDFPIFQKITNSEIINNKKFSKYIKQINNNYYLTNIDFLSYVKTTFLIASLKDGNVSPEEVLKGHINSKIDIIDNYLNKIEYFKSNISDIIESTFSPINNIDLNTPFEDFSSLEENYITTLEALFKNPLTKTILLDLSNKKGIFKALADKYNINKKTFRILINPLGEDFSNVSDLTLNENNLGILQYAYLPIIKIENTNEKEAFLKKYAEYFKDKMVNDKEFNNDLKSLKNLLEEVDYVTIGNSIEKQEDSYVFESIAKPLFINKNLDKIGHLDIPITEYKNFIEEKFGFNVKNYIKHPLVTPKMLINIIDRFLKEREETYKEILGEFQYKNAFEECKRKFKLNKDFSIENKMSDDEFASFAVNYFGKSLFKTPIFEKTLKEAKEIIDSINGISSLQKSILKEALNNPLQIEKMKTDIDKIFVDLKEKYPEKEKEIEEKITLALSKIDKVSNLLIKETLSFFDYFTLYYYKSFLIQKKDDEKFKINMLYKMWNVFNHWAKEVVGLTQEQFQDAFNAFILEASGKKNTIAFGYSMGTGKTRLVLFFSYLNSLFKKKSFFFIQNKNKSDIQEQLLDMLYSLYKRTNFYFNDNEKDISYIPFDIIDTIYPNLFISQITKYMNSSETFSLSYLKEKYYSMINKYYYAIKDIDLNDLEQMIKTKHYKKFINDFDYAFEKEIVKQISFLGFNLSNKELKALKEKIFKNYAVAVFWVEDLIKNQNVSDKDKLIDAVSKKITRDLVKIFNSFRSYYQKQRYNHLSLASNFILSHFPRENTQREIKNKINNNVITYDDIDKLDIEEKALNVLPNKDNLIKLLYKTYEADFSEYALMPFYNYFFEYTDKEKIGMYLQVLFELENIKDFSSIKDFAELIISKSERFVKQIPYIKMQDSAIDAECINVSLKEEDLNNLDEKAKEFLQNFPKAKEILLNFNKYLNDYSLSAGLALFYRKDALTYEKETFFNAKKIYSKKVNLLAKTRENAFTPVVDIKTQENQAFFYILNNAKGNYLDRTNITFKKKNFLVKEINFQFNGGNRKIILDFYNYSPNKEFNLNAGMLFKQKNKGIIAAIDESHKNSERNLNFFRENTKKNGVNAIVSGTLMNGTPKDIGEKLIFENKDNIKTINNILQTNMGIFALEYPTIYENIENNFNNVIKKIQKINKDKITLNVIKEIVEKHIVDKLNLDITDLDKIINLKKKLSSNISKYIFENLSKIHFLTPKEIFINTIAKSGFFVKKIPGITNPTGISTLIFNYPNISLALKDATDRIWDFYNANKILNGLNPIENSYYLKYLNENGVKLKNLYYLFDIIYQNDIYEKVRVFKTAIDKIVSFALEDKTKFNYLKGFFNNLSEKELYKILTPLKASEIDTLGNIFYKLVKQEKVDVPQEKISFIAGLVDLIQTQDSFCDLFELENIKKLKEQKNKIFIDYNKKKNSFDLFYNNKKIPSYINVDLFEIFPNVLKDKTMFKINFYSSSLKEIKTEILNSLAYKVAKSAQEGYNPVLFSSRIDLLILKTLETLDFLIKNPSNQNIPTYLLIVKSNSENFENFVKNIDEKELAEHNIFIKVTTPERFYNDYHYNIPVKANIITAAIYSTLAEGFRLNRYGFKPNGEENKEAKIFYVGEPSNIYTTLQSAARCFTPQRQKGVEIHLSSEKYKADADYVDFDESINVLKKIKKRINKDFFLDYIIDDKIFDLSLISLYERDLKRATNSQNSSIVLANDYDIYSNLKNMRNLLRSMLTIIEFLGGKTNINIQKRYDSIVKQRKNEINSLILDKKLNASPQNSSKKIKK